MKKMKKTIKKVKKKKKIDYKRVYLDTLCIAFIINDSKNESNEIQLCKTNGTISKKLDTLKIIEINVFKEWYNLLFGNESKILGKLSKDGKDWIKLLSLRSWAKKGNKPSPKYLFPKLLENHKYSSNEYIQETIKELIVGNRMILALYSSIEDFGDQMEILGEKKGKKEGKEEGLKEGKEEGLKEGKEIGLKEGKKIGQDLERKKSQIQCAYYWFYFKRNIDDFSFDYKYDFTELNLILQENIKKDMLDEETISKFIKALENKKVI